jgi:hypothetical protein
LGSGLCGRYEIGPVQLCGIIGLQTACELSVFLLEIIGDAFEFVDFGLQYIDVFACGVDLIAILFVPAFLFLL